MFERAIEAVANLGFLNAVVAIVAGLAFALYLVVGRRG